MSEVAASDDGGATGTQSTPVPPEPDQTRSDSSSHSPIWIGALLVALVPALRMVSIVRSGTVAQYSDYWMMAPSVFEPSGWFSVAGLFELRNVHPLVFAKLLYWINLKLSGGSNITLGYIVILLVLAQVVVIAALLRRQRTMPEWLTAVLVVLSSFLLFSRLGFWNFTHAMSGAAWLSANLFVLLALYFESTDRRWPAIASGVAAALSYGTGLMVWPALIVVGFMRHRSIRANLPKCIAAAFSAAFYLWQRSQADSGSVHENALTAIASNGLRTLGAATTQHDNVSAVLFTIAVIAVAVVSLVALPASGRREVAPWVGVFLWSGASAVAIGYARIPSLTDFSTSRYYSLGALCLLAVVVIMATALTTPRPDHPGLARPSLVIVCVVALLAAGNATLAGGTQLARDDAKRPRQELLAIALRIDVEHDTLRWTLFERMPHLSPLFEAIGHYPFNDDFTADCGRIDTRLEDDEVAPALPESVSAVFTHGPRESLPEAEVFKGKISVEPECVVITDRDHNVFGAGATTPPVQKSNGASGYTIDGLAPRGSSQYLMFVRLPGSDQFYPIPDNTEAPG